MTSLYFYLRKGLNNNNNNNNNNNTILLIKIKPGKFSP